MSKSARIYMGMATVLLLAFGAYKLSFPTYSWHQKLTLEVQTPTGVKSASTVNGADIDKVTAVT